MKRARQPRRDLTSNERQAVLNCLHDLAILMPAPDTSPNTNTEGRMLQVLARLLALCAAPQGLLALSSSPVPRLLAVDHLQQKEALLILQTLPLSSPQPVVRDAMVWLSVPLTTTSLQHIWFVLGWPLTTAGYQTELTRAQRLLPFVVDLAGMILQVFQYSGFWGVSSAPEPAAVPSQGSDQQMRELFDTLGHEFRTPLTTIRGYADSLLRHLPRLTDEECQEFLRAIRQAGDRLEELALRLLEVAQLEANAVQLDFQVLDLPSLVQRTMSLAQQWVPEALREKTTFHLHVRGVDGHSAQEIAPIVGHASSLQKVFEHLLENAIRFSPNGGRIDIIVRPAPQSFPAALSQPTSPPYLETCVCDYGIGIPQEHLTRIFDRFHRVNTGLTREVGGLGLGLTICQYLVALHQGHIWAESCPEGGSAFHIWLPVMEAATVV